MCVYMYTCVNTWVSMCMCVWICIYIEAIRLPPDSADCSGHSPTHLSPFITKVSSLLLRLFSLEDQSKSGQITTLKLLRRASPYDYVTIQHIIMSIVFIFMLLSIADCYLFGFCFIIVLNIHLVSQLNTQNEFYLGLCPLYPVSSVVITILF